MKNQVLIFLKTKTLQRVAILLAIGIILVAFMILYDEHHSNICH